MALGAFVIGTADLVVVGTLNLVAGDLGVSVGTAGLLVRSYALGSALGAPEVSALTVRFGRRAMLRAALTVFLLGNVVATVATGLGILLAARLLTGTVHGLFVGLASVVATELVSPERRGQAIFMVLGRIAGSTVVGVPVGTLIGQALGWQAAFAAVVVLAGGALVLTWLPVPAVQSPASARSGQLRAAFAPRVLAMLGVGCWSGARSSWPSPT